MVQDAGATGKRRDLQSLWVQVLTRSDEGRHRLDGRAWTAERGRHHRARRLLSPSEHSTVAIVDSCESNVLSPGRHCLGKGFWETWVQVTCLTLDKATSECDVYVLLCAFDTNHFLKRAHRRKSYSFVCEKKERNEEGEGGGKESEGGKSRKEGKRGKKDER